MPRLLCCIALTFLVAQTVACQKGNAKSATTTSTPAAEESEPPPAPAPAPAPAPTEADTPIVTAADITGAYLVCSNATPPAALAVPPQDDTVAGEEEVLLGCGLSRDGQLVKGRVKDVSLVAWLLGGSQTRPLKAVAGTESEGWAIYVRVPLRVLSTIESLSATVVAADGSVQCDQQRAPDGSSKGLVYVTKLSRDEGLRTIPHWIVIRGRGFGSGNVVVRVGDQDCESPKAHTDDLITCKVPTSGTAGKVAITVTSSVGSTTKVDQYGFLETSTHVCDVEQTRTQASYVNEDGVRKVCSWSQLDAAFHDGPGDTRTIRLLATLVFSEGGASYKAGLTTFQAVTFDGGNNALIGYTAPATPSSIRGLVGQIVGGKVFDLALLDVDVRGEGALGALAGELVGVELSGIVVTGAVNQTSPLFAVGGVAGNLSTMRKIGGIRSTAKVTGLGPITGGLFGHLGLIDGGGAGRLDVRAAVSGAGSVGGIGGQLTCELNCTIEEIHVETALSSTGDSVGGVAGIVDALGKVVLRGAEVRALGAEPLVKTSNSNNVGGVIGVAGAGALEVRDVFVRGRLDVPSSRFVGGMFGDASFTRDSAVDVARADIDVAVAAAGQVGGVFGFNGSNVPMIVADLEVAGHIKANVDATASLLGSSDVSVDARRVIGLAKVENFPLDCVNPSPAALPVGDPSTVFFDNSAASCSSSRATGKAKDALTKLDTYKAQGWSDAWTLTEGRVPTLMLRAVQTP